MTELVQPPQAGAERQAQEWNLRRLAKVAGAIVLGAAIFAVAVKTGVFPTQGPNP